MNPRPPTPDVVSSDNASGFCVPLFYLGFLHQQPLESLSLCGWLPRNRSHHFCWHVSHTHCLGSWEHLLSWVPRDWNKKSAFLFWRKRRRMDWGRPRQSVSRQENLRFAGEIQQGVFTYPGSQSKSVAELWLEARSSRCQGRCPKDQQSE